MGKMRAALGQHQRFAIRQLRVDRQPEVELDHAVGGRNLVPPVDLVVLMCMRFLEHEALQIAEHLGAMHTLDALQMCEHERRNEIIWVQTAPLLLEGTDGL